MESYMIPFVLRDALLCLVFLIGVGSGVVAIVRQRAKVGALMVAGFLLLGIDPVAEFVLFNFVTPNNGVDSNAISWVYACLGGCAGVIGVPLILLAIYFALQPAPLDEMLVITQDR